MRILRTFSWATALVLIVFAVATYAGLPDRIPATIGRMLPSRPHWFNFPDKERFLVLPHEYQAPVIVEMRTMLDITSLGTGLLMLVIQYHLWRVASGDQNPQMMILIAIVLVILSPAILIWLTRVTSVMEREEKRWKAAGAPAR